jgi:hypothetical protein
MRKNPDKNTKKFSTKGLAITVFWLLLTILSLLGLILMINNNDKSTDSIYSIGTSIMLFLSFLWNFLNSLKAFDNFHFRLVTFNKKIAFSSMVIIEFEGEVDINRFTSINFEDNLIVSKAYPTSGDSAKFIINHDNKPLSQILLNLEVVDNNNIELWFSTVSNISRKDIKKILPLYSSIVDRIAMLTSNRKILYSVRVGYSNGNNPYVNHLLKHNHFKDVDIIIDDNVKLNYCNFEINGLTYSDVLKKIDENIFIK